MRAILSAILILFASVAAAETPKLIGRVNDHAGVLSASERTSLEKKLEAIEKTAGSPQVAVLLPATLDGASIEQFANDTFRAWKLGQAGKDNGVLIVIAPKERKWRVEVGYGLEGVIPDSRAKAIIANDMDPNLKGGKTTFYAALDAAVTSIATEIEKERPTVAPANSSADAALWGFLIVALAIAGGIIAVSIGSARIRRREEEQQAASLRAAMAQRSYTSRPMSAAVAGASLGAGLGAGVVAASYASTRRETPKAKPQPKREEPSRSRSSDSDWGSSSSSGWSSSSSDSSSSSSFSGGGGDSGGGGASGGD